MNQLQEALEYVRSFTDAQPKVALVLGSGLNHILSRDEADCTISYADIPHFPASTVTGHEGMLLFGSINGVSVVIAQGRVHYYEGYDMQQVVMPVRLMRLLGAEALILTNAAGGIRSDLIAGTLMLLTDHIASFVPSPLRGKNDEVLGTRFPDMSYVYDAALNRAVADAAQQLSIPLKQGVYLQAPGPQYETPQEIRMYGMLGADAVGMSTACEAIAAVHCSLRVCAVSCIANAAAGIQDHPLSHSEVQKAGEKAAPMVRALLKQSVVNIAKII